MNVGRVGREREGILRSGIDMETVGREEDTEEDMRLKKEGLAGGASGSDMSRGGCIASKQRRGWSQVRCSSIEQLLRQ